MTKSISSKNALILGRADISPNKNVPAGSWGTWKLLYHIPDGGIDDGGAIRIAFRFVSDWGVPQMEGPAEDHYTSIHCSRPETLLEPAWMKSGNIRPYQAYLHIRIKDAPLVTGDTIQVIYGDRSGGCRGIHAQTFVEDHFDFQISVDRFGTGIFETIPDPPCLTIVPNTAQRLMIIAGGDGTEALPVRILIRAEDEWGNPIKENVDGSISIATTGPHTDLPGMINLQKGFHLFKNVVCKGNGILRVQAMHPNLGNAESDPIRIENNDQMIHRFWGDLHGQSGETIGTNPIDQYLHFARDFSLCDFVGHQPNDFQVTDEFWEKANRLAREMTQEGSFIIFPGYEWSGLTPMGGDRNVLFLNEDEDILRSSTIQVKGQTRQTDDITPVARLYALLKKRNKSVLMIPHIGGRRANLDFFNPELEPVVEIHSCWGTFEWFYHDALRRGYRVGVVANSDGHKGRPGTEHAGAGRFGVYGGLTALLAESFTRLSLFDALKNRHCYGTSGPRIIVDATLNGQTIGSEFTANLDSLLLKVNVFGTAGIEQIDLLIAGKVLTSMAGSTYAERSGRKIRIRWSGARILNRNRATDWQGSLKITGNTIVGVEGYAFDSPAEGIKEWDSHSVRWASITTGDEDGLLITLTNESGGTLEFKSGPLNHSLDLNEITKRPLVCEAGGIEQKVVFEHAPQENKVKKDIFWEKHLTLSSDDTISGFIPIHLRIVQTDGHRAWASPWFVKPA